MKIRQKVTLAALLALLAAAGVGLYLTSGAGAGASSSKTTSAQSGEALSINPHYLDTSLRLALLAATPGEQRAAQNALDDSDRELDLQYGYALQRASIEPIPETPEIKTIQNRVANIQKAIQTRKTEVDQLKRVVQRAQGVRQSALEEQLDVSQAELSLDREALGDAEDALDRTGGSLQGRLAKLKAEHDAASKAHDTFKFPPLSRPAPARSLLAKLSRWNAARQEQSQILRARREAMSGAAGLAQQSDALQSRIAAEEAQRKALESHDLTPRQIAALLAARRPKSAPKQKRQETAQGATSASAPSAAANSTNPAVALIRHISADRAMLHILGYRIKAMNDLSAAYAKWNSLAESTGRSDLHGLITGGLWIALLLTFAFFVNRLIDHFFAGLSLERRQKSTLQAVLRISVRLIIVTVILMIMFGAPSHLSTVLGLAGAGMAIALQDFILSFMGWFVLMGRHGIHVGDWVEINQNAFNGVRGEVVEITLFRTVLLETGNWNEAGHLTGRKVAFMNMYAVSGYYFNFSTAGQWLWDELQVAVPASENPYPLIEKIQAMVAKETESQAELAEREWQRLSRHYGMKPLSAQPTVSLKPTDNGVIAVIRYITRADERSAVRYRLNREIVRLFHHGEELVSETQPAG